MVYISGDNNLEDYVVKDLETELGLLAQTLMFRSSRWPIVALVTTQAMATGEAPSSFT